LKVLTTLTNQIHILQTLTNNARTSRQKATAIRIGAFIETKSLFVEVPEQMKRLAINVGSFDRSFEQTPEVFETIGMHFPFGVANGVVNDLVVIILVHADIAAERIGMKIRALQNVFTDVALNLVIASGLKHLQFDARRAFSRRALKQALNGRLALPARNSVLLPLVAKAVAATDESLIAFNIATHLDDRLVLHGEANALKHEPTRLLSDAKRTVKLVGANAVLGVDDQPEGREPLAKGNGAIFKNGSNLCGKLFAAALALPTLLRGKESHLVGLTMRARNLTGWPAQIDHEIQGASLVRKVGNCLLKSLRKFGRFFIHALTLRHEPWLVKYIITFDKLRMTEILQEHLDEGLGAQAIEPLLLTELALFADNGLFDLRADIFQGCHGGFFAVFHQHNVIVAV